MTATTVSNEQILAAAVGKAIAESVTPELTTAVFTEAFRSFMEKPVSDSYSSSKRTIATDTLQEALKLTLKQRAQEFLALPEQAAVLDQIVSESFQMLVKSGKLQSACEDAVSRLFQHVQLRM